MNEAFRKLSKCPAEEDIRNSKETIQTFVAYTYSKKPDCDLDEPRFNLFQKSTSSKLRNLPPYGDEVL